MGPSSATGRPGAHSLTIVHRGAGPPPVGFGHETRKPPDPFREETVDESHNSRTVAAVCRRSVCAKPDPGRSVRAPGAAHGRPRHAAGPDRRAEGTGADRPAGRARQDADGLRAGQGLGHQAGLDADEGAAPADPAGDAAAADAGTVGAAAEEIPGPAEVNARALPPPPRSAAGGRSSARRAGLRLPPPDAAAAGGEAPVAARCL